DLAFIRDPLRQPRPHHAFPQRACSVHFPRVLWRGCCSKAPLSYDASVFPSRSANGWRWNPRDFDCSRRIAVFDLDGDRLLAQSAGWILDLADPDDWRVRRGNILFYPVLGRITAGVLVVAPVDDGKPCAGTESTRPPFADRRRLRRTRGSLCLVGQVEGYGSRVSAITGKG